MAKKKAPKKKVAFKEPQRYVFVGDDDCHDYLIPVEMKEQFETWLEAGPYWEDYEGEDFNLYRIDGLREFSFTDPRSDC